MCRRARWTVCASVVRSRLIVECVVAGAEFFNPSRHLFGVHLSGPAAATSLMGVRVLCAVAGDEKSRVQDVCAGAAIVVVAVVVQRVFASHMPKPQCQSLIPTA